MLFMVIASDLLQQNKTESHTDIGTKTDHNKTITVVYLK